MSAVAGIWRAHWELLAAVSERLARAVLQDIRRSVKHEHGLASVLEVVTEPAAIAAVASTSRRRPAEAPRSRT